MKVAVVIDTWFPAIGGGQVNALEISKRISNKKNKIDIITRNQGKFDEKQFENIKIYRIGKISNPTDNISRLYFLYKTFFLIKKENYDLVHLHAFLPGLLSPLIRAFLRTPVIFTVHGTRMFEENPVHSFGFWLEKFILTKIKYNAQISVTKAFIKFKNVNKDIFYVPNGIDLQKFKKVRVEKAKYPKILWVGRFDPVKRVDLLILAMKSINEKIPNAKLTLVGYGQEENKLKGLVKKLKVKNIQFVGKKQGKDLVKEYRSSHVFVLPSDSEGQPLTILEAKAAGLPIVASNVGDVASLLDLKIDKLVEPGNVKEISDAIISILLRKNKNIPNKPSKLIVNNWNMIGKKTLKVYNKIIQFKKTQIALNKKFTITKHSYALPIISLLIVSAVLRFWGLTERSIFSGETNNILYTIQDILRGKHSVLLGIESASFIHHLFQTPWYLYFASGLFIITKGEPLYFAIFHTMLGVSGIFFLFKTLKNLGFQKAGLISAYISTFLFLSIVLDQTISGVNLVPFTTSVAMFLFSMCIVGKNKNLNYLLLGIWLAFSISIHYQMVIVFILFGIWIFIQERKRIILYTTPVVLSFLPLVVFDIRHNFFNLLGLKIFFETIFLKGSPESATHFFYFLIEPTILIVSLALAKFNYKIVAIILFLFTLVQLHSFITYKAYPSYSLRNGLIKNLLANYESNTMNIYFKDKDSYEYRYLLELRAKEKNINTDYLVIYEPWQNPTNPDIVIKSDKIEQVANQ